MTFAACGGSGRGSAVTPEGAKKTELDGGLEASTAQEQKEDAGRPFAHSSLEASQLIDKAIDAHQDELAACAQAARKKRKDIHVRVAVDIGIDQEGTLLGVKIPKGAPADDDLVACITKALKRAQFPRSNAGVITVKKTFEDVVVAP
jgi:hypothetical protein